jgi:hypothetical protein
VASKERGSVNEFEITKCLRNSPPVSESERNGEHNMENCGRLAGKRYQPVRCTAGKGDVGAPPNARTNK